ncbi:MAG: SMI1/KNR4 family protein [Pirellula sp.]|nr:SMI1/KNR4 family protein [Pirellula sp.]
MTSPDAIQKAIAKFATILIERGVATESDIRGCTPAEIKAVEHDVGSPLPQAYREFLARMGREAGRLYVGTDVFYPAILGVTSGAKQLVDEDKTGVAFPDDAIAFSMHQGYQFLFIRTGEGNDPPVYHYMEQSGVFEKKSENFTKFLLGIAHDEW